MSDLLKTLFYNLSSELDRHFNIMWLFTHFLDERTLSGFGTLPFMKTLHLDLSHFIVLKVSINPKKYEIECSNREIYYQISRVFKQLVYLPYEPYVECFKDFIPDLEMRGRL